MTVEAIISLNDIDTVSGKRIRSVMIPDKEYMRSMETGQPDTTGETAEEEDDRIPVVTFPVTEQKPVPETESTPSHWYCRSMPAAEPTTSMRMQLISTPVSLQQQPISRRRGFSPASS